MGNEKNSAHPTPTTHTTKFKHIPMFNELDVDGHCNIILGGIQFRIECINNNIYIEFIHLIFCLVAILQNTMVRVGWIVLSLSFTGATVLETANVLVNPSCIPFFVF